MKFIKSKSFASGGPFNSEKDDAEVNSILRQLQESGAEILSLRVKLSPLANRVVALYVIEYEAAHANE